jgi:hypothetical protein
MSFAEFDPSDRTRRRPPGNTRVRNSGERKYQTLKMSDVHVHLYGDAAVVTGINTYSIAIFMDVAFGSMHPGGTHFAMGDASVRFVNDRVNLSVYLGTASRDGGESITVE